jgi:MerR family transcriptional regulator, light-induced transcriptional regulator
MVKETFRAKNLTSREAARLLGVSEASIKRWADSGVLPTAKTAGGHRRFRPGDIARFKRSGQSEETPRARKREGATRRPGRHIAEKETLSPEEEKALIEEVFRSLMDGQDEEVSALLVNLYLHGHTVAWIADKFLCPAMRRIGELWHQGQLTIAQEHVATRTALIALQGLKAALSILPEKRLTALCCSTEEDFHDLPVQLAALTLEAAGLEVINLGTSTPFFALAEAVERFRPCLICVASTLLQSVDRAAREYAEFLRAARRAHASVVLGGAGFSDMEARRRLPSDLYAESFEQLEEFAGTLPMSDP